jgi:hypothetical protein
MTMKSNAGTQVGIMLNTRVDEHGNFKRKGSKEGFLKWVAIYLGAATIIGGQVFSGNPPMDCPGIESYMFIVKLSKDNGVTWSSNSTNVYNTLTGPQEINLAVRTLMTFDSGQTQGWSFSLRYDPASIRAAGGDFDATSVTTNGTNTSTVQNGSAPDVDETYLWEGFDGFTQGVVIDNNLLISLGPISNFVTTNACFRLKFPRQTGQWSIPIYFTHDVGVPPVRSVITQGGESNIPCSKKFTIFVKVGNYTRTIGGCSFNGNGSPRASTIIPSDDNENSFGNLVENDLPPGSPGIDFKRGDSNDDGVADIADSIFSFSYLFLGGQTPDCFDAADVNDDEIFDISDPIYLLSHLFIGGESPPPPFDDYGPDLTDETVPLLNCVQYTHANQIDSDNDGITNHFETIIFTNVNVADTDGDGFTDGEEILPNGVPGYNGQSINISKTPFFGLGPDDGANPSIKDIYIQLDYMQGKMPQPGALQLVKNAFLAQPGYYSTILHIDVKNQIAYSEYLSQEATWYYLTPLWERLESIKSNNFAPKRGNVYHYCLSISKAFPGDGESKGWAQEIFADDFIICDSYSHFWSQFDPVILSASCFMHELGHTLGLRHAGNYDGPKKKPNYRSVMSEHYVGSGVDGINCDAYGDGLITYSQEVLPQLDEVQLFELNGLGGSCSGHPVNWNMNCLGDNNFYETNAVSADITQLPPVQYICDGPFDECGGTSPGGDGICCKLNGFNDLAALRYDFRNSPYNLALEPRGETWDPDCPKPSGGSVEPSTKCFGPGNWGN